MLSPGISEATVVGGGDAGPEIRIENTLINLAYDMNFQKRKGLVGFKIKITIVFESVQPISIVINFLLTYTKCRCVLTKTLTTPTWQKAPICTEIICSKNE